MSISEILLTATGSGSYTIPDNVTSILVECWGAGGGGGRAGGNDDTRTGGGGGGYASSLLSVTPNTTHSYVVGNGGAGSIVFEDPGFSGQDTTWDSNVVVARGGTGGHGFSLDPIHGAGGGTLAGILNIGDVTYVGGTSANTGGGRKAAPGAGGAGSTGNGKDGAVGSGTPGGATEEYGGAGGGGSCFGGIPQSAGELYGGGGGGGMYCGLTPFFTPGAAGAQGLIRITLNPINEPSILWNGNTLQFEYVLDNATSYSTTIDGSQMVRTENGTEYSWIPNTNFILEGDVRWISTTQWDGATGWRAFLEYARAKNQFAVISEYGYAGISSYLVEPLNGEHSLEIDGTRRIRLAIRNTTTPYTGF